MIRLLFTLIFIVLPMVISPLRAVSIRLSSFLGFLIIFAVMVWLINRYKTKLPATQIMWFSVLGFLIFKSPIRITYFNSTLTTLLDALIHLSAIFAGYYFTKLTATKSKVIYVVICLILVAVLSFWVTPIWRTAVSAC